MNKFTKISSLICSLIAIAPLTGCGSNNIEPLPSKVDSVKSGLKYICLGTNYTFTYTGSTLVPHERIYTDKSIGIVSSYNPSLDTIYYQDDKGVYSVGYNGVQYVGSEYYDNGKNVWNNKYFMTLKNCDNEYISSISDDVKNLTVKSKVYKIAFLQMVGYSDEEYVNLDSLVISEATYNDQFALNFTYVYKNKTFVYTAHDFGTSKNIILNTFLRNGGSAYTPNANVTRVRELINSNNFVQNIYDLSGVYTNNYYFFNPNYFFTLTNSSSDVYTGYIAVDAPKYNKYGCYSFVVGKDEEGVATYSESPFASYSKPNMVEFFHYPSLMILMKHFEYTRAWDERLITFKEYTPQGEERLMVTDSAILADFMYNFSLDSSYPGAEPVVLGIDYVKASSTKQETIMFVIKMIYAGKYYLYEIPLQQFGKANSGVLEYVLESYKA